ncbi:MAG: hypothetical protein MUC90_06110 [Thermoplasmata archaeon]|nr:hypothetical protein [Thermoplasmata archaeon]
MEPCEYCFERFHHTELEEHKSLYHSEVMRAEETLNALTEREKKGFWTILGFIGLEIVLLLLGLALDIEAEAYYIGLVAAMICAPILIGLIVTLTAPETDRAAKKRARDLLLNRMVKCDICEQMVPLNDYRGHIKRLHPRQVPYEWFRVATLVLLVVIGLGGYVALSIIAEAEILSFEQTAVLVISWIVATCLTVLWMFYLGQVGELKHIKKMRREWEEHRFDPSAEKRH